MTTYTIALLDDHRVVLESVANLLATSDRFRVAGMAHDSQSLLPILNQAQSNHGAVDVLVTDLLMPTGNGTELIPTLKAAYPNLRVLVLSGSVDPALIRQVMQAGADGYVTKTADKAELFDAILAVAAGRRYMDSRIFMLEDETAGSPADNPLTEREAQVARLILDELSSTQIAGRLFISFNTVETHRKRIYQKLGVTTALGLMKYWLNRGLTKQ
ncbi:response regulator [Spirosoma arcticum]